MVWSRYGENAQTLERSNGNRRREKAPQRKGLKKSDGYEMTQRLTNITNRENRIRDSKLRPKLLWNFKNKTLTRDRLRACSGRRSRVCHLVLAGSSGSENSVSGSVVAHMNMPSLRISDGRNEKNTVSHGGTRGACIENRWVCRCNQCWALPRYK